ERLVDSNYGEVFNSHPIAANLKYRRVVWTCAGENNGDLHRRGVHELRPTMHAVTANEMQARTRCEYGSRGRSLRLSYGITNTANWRREVHAAITSGGCLAGCIDGCLNGGGVVRYAIAFRAIGSHVHTRARSLYAFVPSHTHGCRRKSSGAKGSGGQRARDGGIPTNTQIASQREPEGGNVVAGAARGKIRGKNHVRVSNRPGDPRPGNLQPVAPRGCIKVVIPDAIGLKWIRRGHRKCGVCIDRRKRRTRGPGGRGHTHSHRGAGYWMPRRAEDNIVFARPLSLRQWRC